MSNTTKLISEINELLWKMELQFKPVPGLRDEARCDACLLPKNTKYSIMTLNELYKIINSSINNKYLSKECDIITILNNF